MNEDAAFASSFLLFGIFSADSKKLHLGSGILHFSMPAQSNNFRGTEKQLEPGDQILIVLSQKNFSGHSEVFW